MAKYNLINTEEQILKFWDKNKIYSKQKKLAKKNAKKFYFLQGPPYTSGSFHIAHAWNNSLKDMVLRYKRMQGFNVWDRAGWDMHGLPTENGTAKKLGLKTKEDIEKYGLSKFIRECEKFSLHNMHLMEKDIINTGIWMDLEKAYQPIKTEFMETVWWILKQAHENDRLYEGFKTMTWCAGCATALAKHELEYENITEDSVFLKFQSADHPKEFYIIWTTTPWTIPLNLAIMVNPEVDYLKIKVDNEVWIVAKALANVFLGMLGKKYKVLEQIKGIKLEGRGYVHPYEDELHILKEMRRNHHRAFTILLSSEYVDTSGGSGLVHCAPGCGPEDNEIGMRYGLPAFNELDEYGVFSEQMGRFAGKTAKKDDKEFIKDFERKGILIAETKVEHEYPHCWRCHEPVVFRATKQWFLKVEDLKKKMKQLNSKVSWTPDWAGSRAFDSWLDNLRDNSISRQRYWGTPLPIWRCEKCGDYIVVGSVKELKKLAGKLPENIHRPWIDEVAVKCSCGSEKKRVADIVDVWIDSGAASFACLEYPARDDLFKQWWPADFILEATEQVRLWFNTLLIASIAATGRHPYKSVYVHGMINDAQGRKMSKSMGNYITPYEVIDKWGADTLRYYMIGAANPGQEIRYNFDDMTVRYRALEVLWNTSNYLIVSAKLAKVNPSKIKPAKLELEERYMLSCLNSAIKTATEKFDNYQLNEIPSLVEELFLDLSRWYVKMTRDRAGEKAVLCTIYEVLLGCLKLLCPVAPFLTEEIYQQLRKEFGLKTLSIHLHSWPKANPKKIDKKLEEEIGITKNILTLVLASREKAGRGVRWPVKKAIVVSSSAKVKQALGRHRKMICSRANLLDIKVGDLKGLEFKVKVNFQTLGPKAGEDVALVAGKLAGISGSAVVEGLNKTGKYNIKVNNNKHFELTRNDLLIEEVVPDGFAGQSLGTLAVYLNLEETKQMIALGFMREIARKVQDLRKKAGLQKTDKINLQIIAPLNVMQDLQKLAKDLKAKVGAKQMEFTAHVSLKHKDAFTIKGKKLEIAIEKV